MKQILILGTGCPKCETLAANAQEAVQKKSAEYEVKKITDINEILNHGVMMTPGLVVDGEVKSVGKVLSAEEIAELIA
jgi:small redox-active disulfide protein 2